MHMNFKVIGKKHQIAKDCINFSTETHWHNITEGETSESKSETQMNIKGVSSINREN